jgi:hypothetical protein
MSNHERFLYALHRRRKDQTPENPQRDRNSFIEIHEVWTLQTEFAHLYGDNGTGGQEK